MTITTAELYWLRMCFKELECPIATTPQLWCDNMGAPALASNPIFHARTKHVEVDYYFIWVKVLNRDIVASYIAVVNQIACVHKGSNLSKIFAAQGQAHCHYSFHQFVRGC